MGIKKIDDIDLTQYTSEEMVAILLSGLGPESVSKIFPHMKDNDVKRLVGAMSSIKGAPIEVVKKLYEKFFSLLNEDQEFVFGDNRGKDFLVSALGEERARKLMGESLGTQGVGLESVELVDDRALSNFLVNEHPQTSAIIVAHLKAERKANVMSLLPEGLRGEIVLRIANLDYVSPERLAQLDDILKTELAKVSTSGEKKLGGVGEVADLLNHMDKTSSTAILNRLGEQDPELVEKIKAGMFVFSDIILVDDRGIQELLKAIDQKELILSLRNAEPEVIDKLAKNMSERAATLLLEDLKALGPKRLSDVETAQNKVIQTIKDLEASGKAFISRGDDGETLV